MFPYIFYFMYYYYFFYMFIIFLDLQYPSFTNIFILFIGSFQFQYYILIFDFSVQISINNTGFNIAFYRRNIFKLYYSFIINE